MGDSELRNLVKSYTSGIVPLEVYREKRRHMIDSIVQDAQSNKTDTDDQLENDPLLALSQADSKAKSTFNSKSVLIYASISLVLTVVLVLGFLPKDQSEKKQANAGDNPLINQTEISSKAKSLVDVFLSSDKWTDLTINQFILDWELLDEDEKFQARQTKWNEQFISTVRGRLTLAKLNSQDSTEDRILLNSLLATVDPSSTVPLIEAGPEPDKETIAKIESDQAEPGPKQQKKLNRKQLSRMLTKLSKAYEQGNIKQIMRLFSQNAATNHHTSLEEIASDYSQLFKTTSSRQIKFSDFQWTRKGSTIVGKGRYLTHLNPKNTNVDQVFSADVSVHLVKTNKKLKINGLYLSNQKFSTKLNNQEMVAKRKTLKNKSKIVPPSNEELQMLVAKFITYYDDGDVERLMALFSREAQTNETATLDDIRRDYLELFSKTKSRQISIKSLTWKTSGKLAVGSGFFEATIKPQNTNDVRKVSGKIRISATKTDQNVFITRLLHNTQ